MTWPLGRGRAGGSLSAPAESRAPEGVLLYAVGDIHGRADLLDALLGRIVEDAAAAPPGLRLRLIFLGDTVDRGPDSRRVVDRLMGLEHVAGPGVACLMGNHERALLDFLADAAAGPAWAAFGGDATLRSYGVIAPRRSADTAGWEDARLAFAQALPARHRAWLAGLPLSAESGDYLFVHAGVRPGVGLAEQTEGDLLWIREPFLSFTGPHERVIVHGHSPKEAPHLGPWRIGLDTGAYATGRLTALRLEGAERRILQTGGDGGGQEKGLRSRERRPDWWS